MNETRTILPAAKSPTSTEVASQRPFVFIPPHHVDVQNMQNTWLKALTLLSILLLCSCSNDTDTAQYPEMAPVTSQASKLEIGPDGNVLVRGPKEEVQPADVLLKHKDLFGKMESKGSEFAGDPLLESQDSFDEFDNGEIPTIGQGDFSQGFDSIR